MILLGDIDQVWLETTTHARVAPGAVPRGTYSLMAQFDPRQPPRSLRTIYVSTGKQLTLVCSAEKGICREKR